MNKRNKTLLIAGALILACAITIVATGADEFWQIVRENTKFINNVNYTAHVSYDGTTTFIGTTNVTGAANLSGATKLSGTNTINGATTVNGATTFNNGVTFANSTSFGLGAKLNGGVKLTDNGTTITQVNVGTFFIDTGTTGTTVTLTGCTANSTVIIAPAITPGSATWWYATPGTGSFIGKVDQDPGKRLKMYYIFIR